MKEYGLSYTKLNTLPSESTLKGLVIEAHPDDAALGGGFVELASSKSIAMTSLTLTDGGARDLAGFTRDRLVKTRREESLRSLHISGVTDAYLAALPDGALAEHSQEGLQIIRHVLYAVQPDFVVVTHEKDAHPDHASAGFLTSQSVQNEIPVYYMDTVSSNENNDTILPASHVIEIDHASYVRRNAAYMAHVSQVTALPEDEMKNVRSVVSLPSQRGEKYNIAYAAVLFQTTKNTHDIIGELFSNTIKPISPSKAA